mmetsp:Transcript_25946/g.74761  ORF Transcript_25946/g.74761 Transcript_25946/m.74761 type:complete len:204 (+) Transcript_25946:1-612(+)
MQIGTEDNMDLGGLPQDFKGIWWIRWGDLQPIPLYSSMYSEVLVSMAGMRITGNSSSSLAYPVAASAPARRAGHWAYSNTLIGRIAMISIAKKDIDVPMNFEFRNDTNMFIEGGGDTPWTMDKIDDDQWLRTIMVNGEPSVQYTFTRVVMADGTAHPEYFPALARQMQGTEIRVFNSDTGICRACGASFFGTCSHCSSECSGP